MPENDRSFFESLLLDKKIKCVSCQTGLLALSNDDLLCEDCNSSFPIVNRVPLFLGKGEYEDQLTQLRNAYGYPVESSDRLLKSLGSAMIFPVKDDDLNSEATNILGRFPDLIKKNEASSSPILKNYSDYNSENIKHLICEQEHFFPYFESSTVRYRSLRISNRTKDTVFKTAGKNPLHISYHIFDEDGEICVFDGERSAFPIPLEPGRAITVPVKIRAPELAGKYRIKFLMVQENISWFEDHEIISFEINVGEENIEKKIPAITRNLEPSDFTLEKDTDYSLEFIRKHVGGESSRIIEIAGGLFPLSLLGYQPPWEVVSLDICYSEVQMSQIYFEEVKNFPLDIFSCMCADANNLPFVEETFDAAIISAALHHFPDPTGLLKSIKEVIKPGGKFIVVREPSFVNPTDINYLRDLKAGYNEQQFELEEYYRIFTRAGWELVEWKVDFGGSLKMALTYK